MLSGSAVASTSSPELASTNSPELASAGSVEHGEDSVALALRDTVEVKQLRCDTVKTVPLTRNMDRPYTISNGLDGRHVAMWGSHGLYYELANARWEWQRARMFNTIEDKFPSSYVIGYIAPMLERAGAVVLMPRERDYNTDMVVVDNDMPGPGLPQKGASYAEKNGSNSWQDGAEPGFGYVKAVYKDNDNPFVDGTYRMAETTSDDRDATYVTWTPNIANDGRYAVYVSYKTLANSVSDAKYTVYHKDGKTTVSVNQQMGGGTWIYIGTFGFDKGTQGRVVLSNLSESAGVVTADAVRFGGGMGNVARRADGSRVYDNTKLKKGNASSRPRGEYQPALDIQYEVSGYPRYCEGARYYMQWAGMPKSVYSDSNGSNDYVDDYRGRSKWVDYLAGGSARTPNGSGLKIPIDMALAFHTDGGSVGGDKVIGTLAIYKTAENGGRLGDGSSRSACRELTNTVYNTILSDIRKQVEPRWSGRGAVDKGYAEATSMVPSMLLELLSHESFGEMRYGNDPRFKFVVSRAIYKGILKFMSKRYKYDYVVQPLPVSKVAARLTGSNEVEVSGSNMVGGSGSNMVEVSWKAVADSIEPTAVAERYVVYRRVGDGDYDNGTVCEDTVYRCEVPVGKVVSFKVTALNRGGESMDSEVVSVGVANRANVANEANGAGRTVLVVNGFDRVSAADDFASSDDKIAGFLNDEDGGVADGYDISYVGKQKEFRRAIKMDDDDSPGFGACSADYEKMVVAGNTHDYAAVHGESILKAGMNFVSVSRSAVSDLLALATDSVNSLNRMYVAVDLILGKQKQTKFGRKGANALQYKTFDSDIQKLLTAYCKAGGSVFVSGAYVATDLWQNPLAKSLDSDKKFAQNILKYKWRDGKACKDGKVKYVASPLGGQGSGVEYWNTVNSTSYAVESPDAIIPAESSAVTAMRYSENGLGAAVVFGGNRTDHWRTVVMAFPFEAIKDAKDRDVLMGNVLRYIVP